MKKLCLKNMELGDMLSGHGHEFYEMPRGEWQELFQQFLEVCGFDSYGHIEKDELEAYLKLDKGEAYYPHNTKLTPETIMEKGIFSHIGLNRSDEYYFYKGRLYCIYRDLEDSYHTDYNNWSNQFDKQFDIYWNAIDQYLNEHNLDDIAEDKLPNEIHKLKPTNENKPNPNNYKTVNRAWLVESKFEHDHYFDNGTFVIRPFYWGDSEYICQLPNFVYYPKNIQIHWYKYPLRGASCNKNISLKEFKEILAKCKESL